VKAGLLDTVRLGIGSLMLHKLRTLLTTLGVLFGTSSVIAMLAIGEGASAEAQEQIKRLGSQNVILRSVKPQEDPNQTGQQARVLSYGLTRDDLARVRESFPGISATVPVRELHAEVRFRDRAMNPRVRSAPPEYLAVTGRPVQIGRWLTYEDERTQQNVCVLGTEVARFLMPLRSPIGQRVRVDGNYFTVVGTLAPRVPLASDAKEAGADVTGEVYVPLSVGRQRWGDMQVKMRAGSMDMEEVQIHEIVIQVTHAENVVFVANAAREMLSRNHKQRDYEVVVPLELLAQAEEITRIFNIVLGSIAGISLLVGGIGIMNVMLATVTERTREIGVRRALGAKRRHIVTQFLVEGVVLSVGGGALGVLLGLGIPVAVEHFADMRTIVKPSGPLLAFGISAGIGVVFGLYPAWRAAHMDPVEALRHE
jgi:putative ABC transport system permease protein